MALWCRRGPTRSKEVKCGWNAKKVTTPNVRIEMAFRHDVGETSRRRTDDDVRAVRIPRRRRRIKWKTIGIACRMLLSGTAFVQSTVQLSKFKYCCTIDH